MKRDGEAWSLIAGKWNGPAKCGVETADEWARNDTNCTETDERSRAVKRNGSVLR